MRKEKGKFHSFNKTSLQQILMFQKIVMEKKKKGKKKQTQQQQHQNKNKMGASLDGLHLWLGLVSILGESSRNDLEVHGALTEWNSLEGLNKES